MKRQNFQVSIKNIMSQIKDGTLSLNSVMQRRPGQWDVYKQSLLFHSMLNDYIIPPLYFARVNVGEDDKGRAIFNSEIIDGFQRISTCISFIHDEFALDENTPSVVIDDEEIVLAGKKFSELPKNVQEDIKRYNFTGYNLENFTDEEIEEIFFRINNGVALTKGQQSKAKMGMGMAKFITEQLETPFFTEGCHFTALQYRRANDQLVLIQGMALIDSLDEKNPFDLRSLSESDMFDYCVGLRDSYSDAQKKTIRDIVTYLGEAFPEKHKGMKKINIPIVMVVAKKALELGVNYEDFHYWFDSFMAKYKPGCSYAGACSAGSVKKDNTMRRVDIMTKDFMEYYIEHDLKNVIHEEPKPVEGNEVIEAVALTCKEEEVEEKEVTENSLEDNRFDLDIDQIEAEENAKKDSVTDEFINFEEDENAGADDALPFE